MSNVVLSKTSISINTRKRKKGSRFANCVRIYWQSIIR